MYQNLVFLNRTQSISQTLSQIPKNLSMPIQIGKVPRALTNLAPSRQLKSFLEHTSSPFFLHQSLWLKRPNHVESEDQIGKSTKQMRPHIDRLIVPFAQTPPALLIRVIIHSVSLCDAWIAALLLPVRCLTKIPNKLRIDPANG